MITQERLDKVMRMLEERAEYHHAHMLQYHDAASSAAMTAYNSALLMLFYAEKNDDEILNQFDYYHDRKLNS